MSRIVRTALLIVAAAVVLAPSAHAVGCSLGANLGLSIYSPSGGGGSLTSFSVPSGNALLFNFMPGLRVGFAGPSQRQEFFFDAGIQTFSGGGFSASGFQLSANFQQALASEATAPYLDAGVGLVHLGDSNDSGTSITIGGGFGIRNQVADGHGTLRGEVRFDYVTESSSGGNIIIPSGTIIQLKLGFDLWMK
jgi:hypothetical protein